MVEKWEWKVSWMVRLKNIDLDDLNGPKSAIFKHKNPESPR